MQTKKIPTATLCLRGAGRILSFDGVCAAMKAGTFDQATKKLSIEVETLKRLVDVYPSPAMIEQKRRRMMAAAQR